MPRRRRPHKRKSPEELARQYAGEADLRATLDNLHFRVQEFSRIVDAQQPVRTLVKAYVEQRETLAPIREQFVNTLGEVFSVNIRLHRQIEDLEFRLGEVEEAISRGQALPSDRVLQPELPDHMPEAEAISFVLDLDAASRRSQLRLRWPTDMVEAPAREAFKALYALEDRLSTILQDIVGASERLDALSEPLRQQYALVLAGLAQDSDGLTGLLERDAAALEKGCRSTLTLTARRDELLARLNVKEREIGG